MDPDAVVSALVWLGEWVLPAVGDLFGGFCYLLQLDQIKVRPFFSTKRRSWVLLFKSLGWEEGGGLFSTSF